MESTELIIDVRTREEYVKEHIKGALNIPLYDLDFYLDFLKDKNVTIYCDTRVRSKLAEK
jgi:rhodanese-related sulfurtransferase